MNYRQLINLKAYFAEEREIEALADQEEATIREKLLEEINEKVIEYNDHINEYNYTKHCKDIESRGLRFKPIAKQTAEQKWDTFFAAELSSETKCKIHYDQFKWHMFSYEQVSAKEGSDARRAFNRCKKSEAYLFIQCTDEAWYIENTELLTAADLGVDYSFKRSDVYIFDINGKWAYVRTHEPDCGPYFLRKK